MISPAAIAPIPTTRQTPVGLSSEEARACLEKFGPNQISNDRRTARLLLLLGQFKSPIVLILIGAAIVSLFLEDRTDALLILTIVFVSAVLGFWQEYAAVHAVAKLRALVETKARVQRDGSERLVPVAEVVPGDVVLFSAGALVPADAQLFEACELFVNEAALSGEPFPVEKKPAVAWQTDCTPDVFLGTHVVSGTGKAIVCATGKATQFGKIAESLRLRRPETEFEHGIRRFGYLLAEVTLLLVLAIFAFNVFLRKPPLDSFLFALALAVGLTPQLLPVIISVSLARGARRMAERKVIVKRLVAIENFGSMDVLCTDKTGTLTEGEARVQAVVDSLGKRSDRAMLYAWLNATNESGFANPIDRAIRQIAVPNAAGWEKLDEIPYDFLRKRLSVFLQNGSQRLLITKGALREILSICQSVQTADGAVLPLEQLREEIERRWLQCSEQGWRVLGVAYRELPDRSQIARADETAMIFSGLVVLSDPPKAQAAETLAELLRLGVRLKIITGDNALIAQHVAREVGVPAARVLTGTQIRELTAQALNAQVSEIDVFAEVEPMQKERIIRALKKAGHVVGYLGDGINDAPALHAADVGLSVDGAVDVAREAADFVLLEHDLAVLADGVREGRRTFANTLKYVFIATSANFGNMFSMAGASLFLSFLPLLPKQILLINLLTDFPEMTIAEDHVDREMEQAPRRWDIRFIRRFMMAFGTLSSVFDYLTFAGLMWMGAGMTEFRTTWFVESILSATLIVLVVRSRRPFFRSRPSAVLAAATLATIGITLSIPYLPFAPVLGFAPMSQRDYALIGLIVLGYVTAAELVKPFFYRICDPPAKHTVS
jgi:Mg2+-importing ATPase